MRRMLVSVVAVLVLVLSASAGAEIRKEEDAKLQYDVPAGMKVTVQDNMVAIEEDGKGDAAKEIAFFVSKFEKKDQQAAMQQMDAVLSSFLKDVKGAGAPQKAKHNGMDAVVVKATASFNGKPADVSMMILQPPGSKMAIVASVVLQEKKEAWRAKAKQFIDSIKPL